MFRRLVVNGCVFDYMKAFKSVRCGLLLVDWASKELFLISECIQATAVITHTAISSRVYHLLRFSILTTKPSYLLSISMVVNINHSFFLIRRSTMERGSAISACRYSSCFDQVSHNLLLELLKEHIKDPLHLYLTRNFYFDLHDQPISLLEWDTFFSLIDTVTSMSCRWTRGSNRAVPTIGFVFSPKS